MDDQVDYLIFPEATFSSVYENEINQKEIFRIFSMITTMEFPNLNIIAGATAYKTWKGEIDLELSSTRKRMMLEDTTYYHVYNGAFQIGGEKIQMYKKSKLVVGPEFLPFGSYLGFLEKTINNMGGALNGFAIDNERKTFQSKKGKVAPIICYEQNYGEFLRGFVANGADFFSIITNDGWWGNTSGYLQHREFARLRAIEYRRSIARSANMGISCFINQRGDITTGGGSYGESAIVKENISLNNEFTFYSKMGDYLGRLSVFFSLIVLMNLIVKMKMKGI